jgi:hypothetical protein
MHRKSVALRCYLYYSIALVGYQENSRNLLGDRPRDNGDIRAI